MFFDISNFMKCNHKAVYKFISLNCYANKRYAK